MKVLIFTHKSDIDGMGGAILAKLAFLDVTYVLTETFNLQEEINVFISNGQIYDFDLVFVTDLWLEEPTLSIVANNPKLKDKFYLFDHHESALNDDFDKYPFIKIIIKDDKGLCSGTSLFYEYLVEKKYISKENKAISEFVELTRQYDTWEWKNIYNNEMAHELTLLFYATGSNGYIELIYNKLSNTKNSFEFDKLERMLIDNKKGQIREKVVNYSKKVFKREIYGLKAGIFFIAYDDRNDLVEYLREINMDIDFAMMVAMDVGTISYRSMNHDVNVRLIAEHFNGKGHDHAASSPLSEEQKNAIIALLTN